MIKRVTGQSTARRLVGGATVESRWQTHDFDDLSRELRGWDPCLALRVKGSPADTVKLPGESWQVVARSKSMLLLVLAVIQEVAPDRFVYDAATAGENVVMLYEALEATAAKDDDYDVYIALWLPETARLLEREPGPWSVLAPEVLWSATEGQHVTRRQLLALGEYIRSPASTRHSDIRDWLRGFVRARGVLLQLEENTPIWEY